MIESWTMKPPKLRTDQVVGTCETGAYVGNTVAGLTDLDSVKLVRWDKIREKNPLVDAYIQHHGGKS